MELPSFYYNKFSSQRTAMEYKIMVIPCEITHSKNESLPIVFIRSTQSVHPIRFNNPEYQPPVTSGSRETGCTNFVN